MDRLDRINRRIGRLGSWREDERILARTIGHR
jgi:hypothetical protein